MIISKLPTLFIQALASACLLRSVLAIPAPDSSGNSSPQAQDATSNHKVIILGAGVAGIIAARTLKQRGITDFLIIDGLPEIGGRMMSKEFGKLNGQHHTIEVGANWIQGTQVGNGPANPILELAKKHGVKTQFNDLTGSITTYDTGGPVNFVKTIKDTEAQFDALTAVAGNRVDQNLVDLSARTGYSFMGAKPSTAREDASEFFIFDWEYAQSPAESSLIASSWNNNYTYNLNQGGFSDDNFLSIEQRGFKTLIQEEAKGFLTPSQILYKSTVKTVKYTDKGVTVTLVNGDVHTAEYALCTFSLGVLQNDDVIFEPALPDWKEEAIQSMVMGIYTKIFFQFPEKFWFDTEMGIYADNERGKYAVWQSLDHPNFLPGSKIIFVTVVGDYSKRVENMREDQVEAECLAVLKSMFPGATIPKPLDFFFQRWGKSPLFRGSYSNWPPSFSSDHQSNIRANLERLYFAGEATSRKYFGFLHGAYYEGLDMGTVMANCILQGSCTPLPRYPKIVNAKPYEK